MKILFLTERLGSRSGWERYSVDLITELKKNGHEVLVLCAQENADHAEIRQQSVLPPALSSRRCFWFASVYARSIDRILQEDSFVPDVVHCLIEPYARIGQKVVSLLDRPLILTMHGSFAVRPFLSVFYSGFARSAYLHASRIICISTYTEQRVKKYAPDAKTEIIPNGTSFGSLSTAHYSVPVKKPHLLSVGAVKERKGYLELLRAMPLVREAVPDVKLTIVGNQSDTSYVKRVSDYIDAHNLSSTVRGMERVSDAELQELYRDAKVFVLTPISSERSFEGFGLVYLEANAYGVPVVGSYGNGGEDAIAEGKSGFLVRADNPKEIADRVIKLLRMSGDEYMRLSEGALGHVAQFSWEKSVQQYERVYENV